MESKLFLIVFFVISLASCANYDNKKNCSFKITSENTEDYLLLFYIDSIDIDSCIYYLKSSWLNNQIQRKMYFDGENIYVDLANENKFSLLSSYKDTMGTSRIIKISNYDFFKTEISQEDVIRNYKFSTIGKFKFKNENILKINIENAFKLPEDYGSGYLDAILFFSDKMGFIGSYFFNSKWKNAIIYKQGNILDGIIDYSEYHFSELK